MIMVVLPESRSSVPGDIYDSAAQGVQLILQFKGALWLMCHAQPIVVHAPLTTADNQFAAHETRSRTIYMMQAHAQKFSIMIQDSNGCEVA